MSRINTNVSSLLAQTVLGRSNSQLQESLTRLSTGLRINTGKDDPSGLIASENLRRDIVSVESAVANSERANQIIATADSSLGQVSSLLNDIRGLVTESANTGALSDEQIAANQLQVDSSLEALNRIAQTTSFQGRRLLDGSLDFISTAGAVANIDSFQIDQANLGATGQIAVDIDISTAATQAIVTNAIPTAITQTQATGVTAFTADAISETQSTSVSSNTEVTTALAQATGTITLSNTSSTLDITVTANGATSGATGNTLDVTFGNTGTGAAGTADITLSSNVLTVNVSSSGATVTQIAAQIDAFDSGSDGADFVTSSVTGGGNTYASADNGNDIDPLSGGVDQITGNEVLTVTADAGSGATPNGLTVTFTEVNGAATSAAFDSNGNVVVTLADSGTISYNSIAANITTLTGYSAAYSATGAGTPDGLYNAGAGNDGLQSTFSGGITAAPGADVLTVTADTPGTAANGVTVTFTEQSGIGGTTPTASVVGGNIVVLIDDTADTAFSAITSAINSITGYSAAVSGTGDKIYDVSAFSSGVVSTIGNGSNGGTIGVAGSGGLAASLVFELSGTTGSEVFNFEAGTSAQQITDAVNLVSDAIGITATNVTNTLTLTSSAYGTNAFVSANVLSEGTGGTFETNLSASRVAGTDIVATVNGVTASGDGNKLSINTSTLDLTVNVSAGSATGIDFVISGGGAQFQLGPDVVSNQQARLGIQSVNTARLGGISGKLFSLGSGGTAALGTDANKAALIIGEAINQVTGLRGRLGAFQKTTVDTNINALSDVLVNLTEAESVIRDADFARESANLTRAQILVQSGTSVLAIANSNPQNVLALLR